MLNIGLTGGIACGKSTVTAMLQKKGAHVIDFDSLAHLVEEPERPAWREIVDCFGAGILSEDRTIDRGKLGAVVFADREKLLKLNEIVHPAVFAEWQRRIGEIEKEESRAIIISDIPLLIEAGVQSLVDLVILVYITPDEQLERLMKRNGFTKEEATVRMAAQMPIRDKLPHADIVLNNQGSLEHTGKIVDKLWELLLTREREKGINYG